ncbi:MAG: YIP1 family protein [Candidatus Marinimicrobia bacterium]|nr:YIP1 family protein [FCB group bacterium]MBL7025032.1 YIP1 family protein [Candidatus Neomarinimicrobiota bacterium]
MENTSFLQRIINLFFIPSKAFDGLVDEVSYKDWLYPLIIVSLALLVLPYAYLDISLDEGAYHMDRAIQSIQNNSDIPEERSAMIIEGMQEARENIEDARNNPFAFKYLWIKILIPIMLIISAAVFALILRLVGNFGMGGQVKFIPIFTVVMMSYLIGGNGIFLNSLPGSGTLELLVKTPLIVMKESTRMMLSAGLLFDHVDSFVKQFVNQIDIFRVWGMIVMGFGFAKLYNKSTATGIMAVGLPWLIFVSIGAALLQSNPATAG